MLALKLSRTGKTKEPHYRLIVLEKTKDPWGDYLENLGYVNTRVDPHIYQLKSDRIKYWLEKGAQPTDTVHNILVTQGLIVAPKRKVSSLGKAYREKIAAETKAKVDAEAKEKAAAKAAAAAPAPVVAPAPEQAASAPVAPAASAAPTAETKADEKK